MSTLYNEILTHFSTQKIAVIGDLILDKYVYGNVDRISPEAPVPVVKVTSERFVPGGAANVAANISTLSGQAFLFGITGKDLHRDVLIKCVNDLKIDSLGILTDPKKQTIQKIRIIGMNQQLLRIDNENTQYIETHLETEFLEKLNKLNQISAIIISDYAKGTITKELLKQLIIMANEKNIPLIVDPKPKHKAWYKSAFLITPNKKEAQEMSGIIIETEEDFIKAGEKLVEELSANIIITAGADGMYIFEKGKESQHLQTVAREVYDVSGAGDTVVATLALAISSGVPILQSAKLANIAAGIKVGKSGTQPVYLKELQIET
ncbi:MAG: D-glycero-beta-D-manno-heptose-7-phosphate kinase [Candidatus Cloacimonetes bacterium]|nr:D-glycero-beta-D-manno-heptose-7-phosphate kinase [Candidatus Cloacimonadota bacterium]